MPGSFTLPMRPAIECVDRDLILHVHQPIHKQLAAQHAGVLDDIVVLRHDSLPLLRWRIQISPQNLPLGRSHVRLDQERVGAGIDQGEAVVDAVDHWRELPIRRAQVLDQDVLALRRHAAADGHDEPVAVVRRAHADQIQLAKRLALVLLTEDHLVRGGVRAESVPVDQRARVVEDSVIEAGFIRADLHPHVALGRKPVCKLLSRRYVHHANFLLVRAALANAVGQQRPVIRHVENIHRRVLVGAQLACVHQALIRARRSVPYIDGSLVLIRQPLPEEVKIAALAWHRVGVHPLQLRQLRLDLRPDRHLLQVAVRIGVLLVDP